MLAGHTLPLPGAYPHIVTRKPSHDGQDNLGMGYTTHGEQFLLKKGGPLGTAEFVGANLCELCGIPACLPTVVTVERLGIREHIFGSRIDLGLHAFDQTNIAQWQRVMAVCSNPSAFSALLAIDLALGNDDRHWKNWLAQNAVNAYGADCVRLRAMDFSRSWPVHHPAQHPMRHQSTNTWSAIKDWEMLGVHFDLRIFHETCAKISSLNARWLRGRVLQQLSGVFLTPAQIDHYCLWWSQHWQAQVIDAIDSLENGVRP